MSEEKKVALNAVVMGSGIGISSLVVTLLRYHLEGKLRAVVNWVGVSNSSYVMILLAAGVSYAHILADLQQLPELEYLFPFKNLLAKPSQMETILYQFEKRLRSALHLTEEQALPSLREFFERTGQRVILVTFNRTLSKIEYLYDLTYPDLSIIDALALSMATPGVFQAVQHHHYVYLDGSVVQPYPVTVFVETPLVKVLGLRLKAGASTLKSSPDPITTMYNNLQTMLLSQSECLQLDARQQVPLAQHEEVESSSEAVMEKAQRIIVKWESRSREQAKRILAIK